MTNSSDDYVEKIHGLEKEVIILQEKVSSTKRLFITGGAILFSCIAAFWGFTQYNIGQKIQTLIDTQVIKNASDKAEEAQKKIQAYIANAKNDIEQIKSHRDDMLKIHKEIKNVREQISTSKVRKFAKANEFIKTSKTQWNDIKGMSLKINNDVSGQFLILFYASEVQSQHPNNAVSIRLLIDGNEKSKNRHEFSTVGWALRDVYLHFIENLEPGTHKIQIQWKAEYKGKVTQASRYNGVRSLIALEL
jgi:hypothetical protein